MFVAKATKKAKARFFAFVKLEQEATLLQYLALCSLRFLDKYGFRSLIYVE